MQVPEPHEQDVPNDQHDEKREHEGDGDRQHAYGTMRTVMDAPARW